MAIDNIVRTAGVSRRLSRCHAPDAPTNSAVGEIGRDRHVREAVWEGRIEDHLQPIDGHDTAIDDFEALRRLHPAIGGENPERRNERARSPP